MLDRPSHNPITCGPTHASTDRDGFGTSVTLLTCVHGRSVALTDVHEWTPAPPVRTCRHCGGPRPHHRGTYCSAHCMTEAAKLVKRIAREAVSA